MTLVPSWQSNSSTTKCGESLWRGAMGLLFAGRAPPRFGRASIGGITSSSSKYGIVTSAVVHVPLIVTVTKSEKYGGAGGGVNPLSSTTGNVILRNVPGTHGATVTPSAEVPKFHTAKPNQT